MSGRVLIVVLVIISALALSGPGQNANAAGARLGVQQDQRVEPREIPAANATAPLRLSQTSAGGSLPSITQASGGTVVVAWQQNVPLGTKVQQEIFARSSADGLSFGPVSNISQSRTNSREPFLLNTADGNIHAFYQDLPGSVTTWQIIDSVWSAGAWYTPTLVSGVGTWTYQDPAAVQSTDGTVWYVTQAFFGGGTWTDAVVQKLGVTGPGINLSRDGSAVHRPAIVEGDNGQIYVGWLDHGNERPGITPGFKVRQWTGTNWVALPDPSNEGYAAFPALAYHSGLLYAAWPSQVAATGIKIRTWNGTVWSPITRLANSTGARFLKLVVTANGNMFAAWDKGGVVYLQENGNPAIALSTGLAYSQQPSLFVDDNDVAYVAFQNGAIWYTSVH